MREQPIQIPTQKKDDTEKIIEKKNIVLMTGTQQERSLRHLAGLVEKHFEGAYDIHILNLGTKADAYEQKNGGYPEELRKEVLEFIAEKKPELVGISMIDFGVDRISQLIKEISQDEAIQKNKTKILAGGPFAIEHSERCLDIEGIDAVCYSKGWNFAEIVEACGSDEWKNIPGLMIKTGVDQDGKAEYIKTPPPNLKISLSDQPLPYESLENTHAIYKGHLTSTAETGGASPVEHHQLPHKHTAVLVTSEGCVNNCRFCSIPNQHKIFEEQFGGKTLRRVNFIKPEKAIELIKNYTRENPNTEYILFNDNDFTARETRELEEFAKLYKKEIGLPFYCQCSPNTATAEKIQLLREAGMDTFDTGVQGSKQANDSVGYNRACTDKQVLDVARNLSAHLEKRNDQGEVVEDGLKAAFDFINRNPIHTKEDMLSTIGLIKEITETIKVATSGQGSWNMAVHNLTLDVDRELAQDYVKIERADGIPKDVEDSDYHNASINSFYVAREPYLNIVLEWMGGLHDQIRSGRLPKYSEDFFELIKDAMDDELKEIISRKKESIKESIDLLTDPEVYSYLGNRTDLRSRETLNKIDKKIPEIHYSYHRPDRYDFDYSSLEKQIQK